MPTEYILAYHCAPAFAGIKPSNIASCSKRENPNITVQIKMLNEKLNKNDIYIDVLCECGERVLLMVYRKQKLCEYLQRDDIKSFLCDNGYPKVFSLIIFGNTKVKDICTKIDEQGISARNRSISRLSFA